MLRRFSSRRKPLSGSFLNERLAGATGYERIAGYFSSSILEVAGERIESVASAVKVSDTSRTTSRHFTVRLQSSQ